MWKNIRDWTKKYIGPNATDDVITGATNWIGNQLEDQYGSVGAVSQYSPDTDLGKRSIAAIPMMGPGAASIIDSVEHGKYVEAARNAGKYAASLATMMAFPEAKDTAAGAVKSAYMMNKLDAATAVYKDAHSAYSGRLREFENASRQASAAEEQALSVRKVSPGDEKAIIAADENASAARANASKAQKALTQAEEIRDQHGVKMRQIARQKQGPVAAAKADPRRAEDHAGAHEDFQSMAPPTRTGPAAYNEHDLSVARTYLEDEHSSKSLGSLQDHHDALDKSVKDIDNKIEPYLQKYAAEPLPPTTNIKMQVADKLAAQDQVSPGFLQKGLDALTKKHDITDMSVKEADALRETLNAENRDIMSKHMPGSIELATKLKTDPEFAANYYAMEAIRDGIDGVLEDHGVNGLRDMRRDQMSLIKVREAVSRQLLKGDQVVRGTGQSGPMRQAAQYLTKKGTTAAGAGAGAVFGPGGAIVGGVAGNIAGERLGRMWTSGDLTRDQLASRTMRVSGAGRAKSQLLGGEGTPATRPAFDLPPVPSTAMSPEDVQKIQRELSPLHGELATHYGEHVNDVSYEDLESRFMEDIADKRGHGVALEPGEKQLLGKINQQNAADALAAKQATQEAALKGKQVGQATLPENAEPALHIEDAPHGMSTQEVLSHELAHAVVGNEKGLPATEIRSHNHPVNDNRGRYASAAVDWSEFMKKEGGLDLNKVRDRMPDLAATYVAGGVANDLWHNIPFTENKGLGSDIAALREFMQEAGFTKAETARMIAQAADDAAQVLQRPGVRDIIEQHAEVREPGLSNRLHFSQDRLQQIYQDVKGGANEPTTGKSARTAGEVNQGTGGAGTGREGKVQAGTSESVREKSEGSSEGKGARGPDESSTSGTAGPSGITKPEHPAISAVKEDKDVVTVYHGEGAAGGAGAGTGWFTTNPERAASYGGRVYSVDVPRSEFEAGQKAARKSGSATTGDTVLGPEWYDRGKLVKVPSQAFELGDDLAMAKTPPERSTGNSEHDRAIKEGGGVPGGMLGRPEDPVHVKMFHDPQTGTTLGFSAKEPVTAEATREKIAASRKQYAVAEKSKTVVKADVATAADEFNRRQGRPAIDTATKPHDVQFAKRVADAYEQMQHNPNDPKVKAAYEAMKNDVDKQWSFATKEMGIKFEPWTKEGQPYANSKEMVADVKDNKHLYFFQGGESPVDNPLQQTDPATGLSYNDKFRAVHDLFGHAAQGNQFGPKGEEVAYQLHRQMFSPEAVPALTSETRGQNSWVNFGKHLRTPEGNIPRKGESGFVPQTERPYAQQKTGVLPEEFHAAEPKTWAHDVAENLEQAPAGGINPNNPEALSKRYGFEILPEARQALENNPTAEDFLKYAEQHGDKLGAHPDIKLGWDTTGPKPELNIGAATDDLEKAKTMAAKLDQRALWDNKEEKTIDTGGKGEKTVFPKYPFEQRLKDLDPALSRAPKPELDKQARNLFPEGDETTERSYIMGNGDIRSVMDNDHFGVSSLYPDQDLHDEDSINQFMNDTGALRTGWYDGTFLVHGGEIKPSDSQLNSLVKQVKYWTDSVHAKYLIETPNGTKELPEYARPGEIRRELVKLYNQPKDPALSKSFDVSNNLKSGGGLSISSDAGEVRLEPIHGEKALYVSGIEVEDLHRGQGYGQKLYDRAIQEAKQLGYKKLYSSNEANRTPEADAAWERLKQRYPVEDEGGAYSINLSKVNRVLPEDPAMSSPRGSTVPLMENPLKVKGTGDQGRITTIDVAKELKKFTNKQLPALEHGEATSDAQAERAKSIADDEAKYQLNQANSGKAWYTTDIADHDKILQEMRPELKDPAKMSLFKMSEAILSSGQKPYGNLKAAIKAWDYYNETGEFSPMNPNTKQSWGPRGAAAYGNAMQMLNSLIEQHGEKGASDWLLNEHHVSELRQYNKDLKGKMTDPRLGALVLGEKRGPFAQNLHGIESAFTADMWVNRTWNRWMGTQEIAPDGELRDSPRNNTERGIMKQSFEHAAGKLGLTTSSLQAVLWYYEQALYGAHGVPKESWNFADAARRIQQEQSQGELFQNETKQPGAIHALDFIRALKGTK
jgi:GNAT superfamily N-acetyltransferase